MRGMRWVMNTCRVERGGGRTCERLLPTGEISYLLIFPAPLPLPTSSQLRCRFYLVSISPTLASYPPFPLSFLASHDHYPPPHVYLLLPPFNLRRRGGRARKSNLSNGELMFSGPQELEPPPRSPTTTPEGA